jgi:hypothetical protein
LISFVSTSVGIVQKYDTAITVLAELILPLTITWRNFSRLNFLYDIILFVCSAQWGEGEGSVYFRKFVQKYHRRNFTGAGDEQGRAKVT